MGRGKSKSYPVEFDGIGTQAGMGNAARGRYPKPEDAVSLEDEVRESAGMAESSLAVSLEHRIWIIRGQRVMLDLDLAEIYGVPTKRVNEQVKRNIGRFPSDFMFRLNDSEADALLASRSQNATLKRGFNLKYRPYAFTEHGAVMLSSVLNSPLAVQVSVAIARAFVRIREILATHGNLVQRLESVEYQLTAQGVEIKTIFEAIEELKKSPPEEPPKRIGFRKETGEPGV